MMHLAGSSVADCQLELEGRCAGQNNYTVCIVWIMWRKGIVHAVGESFVVLELSGRPCQYLLLKEQPLRARYDHVFVLRQRVCSITNLFYLVVNPRRLRCMKLETRPRLNAAESRLI